MPLWCHITRYICLTDRSRITVYAPESHSTARTPTLACRTALKGSLGSVAFMNLNLAYNSVGFYQLSKLACIPVTLLLERVWYGRSAPRAVKLALLPILAGVGLATVTDVSVNAAGTVLAAVAVLCTVCSQIFTSRFQQELG
jgi:solute carrier family 35, member E3